VKKSPLIIIFFLFVFRPLWPEMLHSPTWGFRIDLPEGYEFSDGNGRDRFSFEGPSGARFDIVIYNGVYKTMKDLLDDAALRLKNKGDVSFFDYGDKLAALIELQFDDFTGWGLSVELGKKESDKNTPMLLALAYGKAGPGMDIYHFCALDSIVPSKAELRYPGPVMEFGYPRGERIKAPLANTGLEAWICENDAEAAQALVDREFALLRHYVFLDNWREAWVRYYRAIYRDSWDRLADAVFQLEREWQAAYPAENLSLAKKALAWVQGFKYERDLEGSDFVNLVSAAIEGRGDCDSRAMLWALILAQADIPAAIMVSRDHSHAMGLADIPAQGARFEAGGKKWLVAETTAPVDIGLIAQDFSEIESWLGVIFE
jgi:hypothetical protein